MWKNIYIKLPVKSEKAEKGEAEKEKLEKKKLKKQPPFKTRVASPVGFPLSPTISPPFKSFIDIFFAIIQIQIFSFFSPIL